MDSWRSLFVGWEREVRYIHRMEKELVRSIEVAVPSGYPRCHDVLISHKVTERRTLLNCATAQEITLRKHSGTILNVASPTPPSLTKYGALGVGDEILGTCTIWRTRTLVRAHNPNYTPEAEASARSHCAFRPRAF